MSSPSLKRRFTVEIDPDAPGPPDAAHELLRYAIRHSSGDDYIVLTTETAMELMLEWDGLKGRGSL